MTETAGASDGGTASLAPDLRADLVMSTLGEPADVRAMLNTREGRVALTKMHPLVFALVYLSRHMKDASGEITFADMHVDLYDLAAREWTQPNEIKGGRDAVIAPRECGKSTTLFLTLPLWAAAHGYSRFVAAFSDTAGQARTHLQTFKRELETNDLLRSDYPQLCRAARRTGGVSVSDRQDMYLAESGFAFTAMGIDGPAHGLKIGELRPDLIICDDISGGIGNVTLHEEKKRLETLRGSIFYLNLAARFLFAGTTTISGGITHQLVQGTEDWVKAERIRTRYYPALYRDDTGEQRSTWPAKWPVPMLLEERRVNPREFARNMQNQPVPVDSEYWTSADFTYGTLASPSRRVIAIDPAVTTRRSSDETGIAVVAYSVSERKACVEDVRGVRMKGEPLRQLVLDMIARSPGVDEVIVERNQGGSLMADAVFHSMPVPVRTVHNSVKKEIRFEQLLGYYRRGAVLHAERMHDLEQQMMETPNALHDDLVDAVAIGVSEIATQRGNASRRLRSSRV